MQTQLLISDKIEIDETDKNPRLGKIINFIEVETLPFVSEFNIYAKIQYIHNEEPLEIQIEVHDDNERLVAHSSRVQVRNIQPQGHVPSTDCFMRMSVILTRGGNHNIELFVDDEKKITYPLMIRVKDLEFQ